MCELSSCVCLRVSYCACVAWSPGQQYYCCTERLVEARLKRWLTPEAVDVWIIRIVKEVLACLYAAFYGVRDSGSLGL